MSPLTEPTKLILKKESVAATDTNIREVSLLLHGDGTNGSTTITDSSLNPKTVTAVGDAQISTAIADPFGNSTGVLAFDGTGDYLTLPMSGDLSLLTFDFTIEGWINVPVTDGFFRCVFSVGYPVQVYHTSGNVLAYFSLNDGGNYFVNPVAGPASSLATNTWTHFAVTRSGSTFRLFVNGAAGTAVTTTGEVFATASQPGIGTFYPAPNAYLFTGYIDELRITKGVARYTSNFTPPTAPFPDF